MRMALIGDIHAYKLGVAPWRLLNRRIVGQINLWAVRRKQFDMSLLPHVVQRIEAVDPHWLMMSGDLTTTSLKAEFNFVADNINRLPGQIKVCMVPGNHDRYTFSAHRLKVMEKHFREVIDEAYPRFEPLTDAWHLLALDSAVPRVTTSRGRLGRRQMEDAKEHLRQLDPGTGLVVISHYPFDVPQGKPAGWGHQLEDAMRLRELLASHEGPVLYLHGHIHEPWCWRVDDKDLHHVVCINAGSPTMMGRTHPHGQGFWQIDLPEDVNEPATLSRHVPHSRDDDGWEVLSIEMPEIQSPKAAMQQ